MEKRNRKRRIKFWVTLCCVLVFQNITVRAAEQSAEVTVPVEQVFTTEQIVPADLNRSFSYQMQAVKPLDPMPEGSENGRLEFRLKDNQQVQLGPIRYQHGGVYEYEIRQIIATKEQNYSYDEQIYHVSVYVENTTDEKMVCQIIVENEKGEKTDGVIFRNSYQGKTPGKPSNVKTGDEKQPFWWMLIAGMSWISAFAAVGFARKRRMNVPAGIRREKSEL